MVLQTLHLQASHTHACTHHPASTHATSGLACHSHQPRHLSVFSLTHTHTLKESLSIVLWELERCPLYFCIDFWFPAPAPFVLRAANMLPFCVCECMGVCVFSMCYLVIDYKRLFNFISPHVGINLHSLSGVNGVSRWLARKIFEDCRLAGVCIQPPALFLLIDLLLPFLFSGCFGFSSF